MKPKPSLLLLSADPQAVDHRLLDQCKGRCAGSAYALWRGSRLAAKIQETVQACCIFAHSPICSDAKHDFCMHDGASLDDSDHRMMINSGVRYSSAPTCSTAISAAHAKCHLMLFIRSCMQWHFPMSWVLLCMTLSLKWSMPNVRWQARISDQAWM